MTTLTEVVRHPVVRERFSILLEAAEAAASPQIRNQGTIGGNVSQDTRCWYYRSGWPCYRAGGNICYADTPEAHQPRARDLRCRSLRRREPVGHRARTHRARCADGHPPARGGERVVAAEDYFIGPGTDITRMTYCSLAICSRQSASRGRLPVRGFTSRRSPIGTSGTFRSSTSRPRWSCLAGRFRRIRVAANAVAARPRRLVAVEKRGTGSRPQRGDGDAPAVPWPLRERFHSTTMDTRCRC